MVREFERRKGDSRSSFERRENERRRKLSGSSRVKSRNEAFGPRRELLRDKRYPIGRDDAFERRREEEKLREIERRRKEEILSEKRKRPSFEVNRRGIPHRRHHGSRKPPILILEKVPVPVPVKHDVLSYGLEISDPFDERGSRHPIEYLDRRPGRLNHDSTHYDDIIEVEEDLLVNTPPRIPLSPLPPVPPVDLAVTSDLIAVSELEKLGQIAAITEINRLKQLQDVATLSKIAELEQAAAIENQAIAQAVSNQVALKQLHDVAKLKAFGQAASIAATAKSPQPILAGPSPPVAIANELATSQKVDFIKLVLKHGLRNALRERLRLHLTSKAEEEAFVKNLQASKLNLIRRLTLLKPYFTSDHGGFIIPRHIPNIPQGVEVSPFQMESFPKIYLLPSTRLLEPEFHLPSEIANGIQDQLDVEFVEHVLRLPEVVFSQIFHTPKKDFILTLFPRLYRETVKNFKYDPQEHYKPNQPHEEVVKEHHHHHIHIHKDDILSDTNSNLPKYPDQNSHEEAHHHHHEYKSAKYPPPDHSYPHFNTEYPPSHPGEYPSSHPEKYLSGHPEEYPLNHSEKYEVHQEKEVHIVNHPHSESEVSSPVKNTKYPHQIPPTHFGPDLIFENKPESYNPQSTPFKQHQGHQDHPRLSIPQGGTATGFGLHARVPGGIQHLPLEDGSPFAFSFPQSFKPRIAQSERGSNEIFLKPSIKKSTLALGVQERADVDGISVRNKGEKGQNSFTTTSPPVSLTTTPNVEDSGQSAISCCNGDGDLSPTTFPTPLTMKFRPSSLIDDKTREPESTNWTPFPRTRQAEQDPSPEPNRPSSTTKHFDITPTPFFTTAIPTNHVPQNHETSLLTSTVDPLLQETFPESTSPPPDTTTRQSLTTFRGFSGNIIQGSNSFREDGPSPGGALDKPLGVDNSDDEHLFSIFTKKRGNVTLPSQIEGNLTGSGKAENEGVINPADQVIDRIKKITNIFGGGLQEEIPDIQLQQNKIPQKSFATFFPGPNNIDGSIKASNRIPFHIRAYDNLKNSPLSFQRKGQGLDVFAPSDEMSPSKSATHEGEGERIVPMPKKVSWSTDVFNNILGKFQNVRTPTFSQNTTNTKTFVGTEFPKGVHKLPTFLRKTPPCSYTSQVNKSFCLFPEGYQSDVASIVVKRNKNKVEEMARVLRELPRRPRIDLRVASHQIPSLNLSVSCETEELEIQFSWARDVFGSWLSLIQTEPFVQKTLVTTCGASSRAKGCQPLLQPRPLLAFHPRDFTRRAYIAEFPLPVGCVYAENASPHYKPKDSLITDIATNNNGQFVGPSSVI